MVSGKKAQKKALRKLSSRKCPPPTSLSKIAPLKIALQKSGLLGFFIVDIILLQ